MIRDVRGIPGRGGRRSQGGRGRASSSPSASCRPSPKRATATSGAAAGTRRRAFPIAQFVEKPDLATAQALRRVGRVLLEQRHVHVPRRARCSKSCDRLAPAIYDGVRAGVHRREARSRFHAPAREGVRALSERFDRLRGDGEDRSTAVVVPLDAGWSDVGSWSALHEALAGDERGNVTHRRRAHRGHAGLLSALDQPPGRGRRARGSRRRRNQGRGAGRAEETACRT